jgi:phenylalanyl-tRNA synthetase beta chain
MKITLSWLKEFLETKASVEEIVRTLTAIGLEVESVQDPSAALGEFTIAHIKEAVQHPNADKLRVCKVETGSSELQVVCGAANARAGIYVVLAPVGSIIPNGGMKIKQSSIRNVESQGMLCSAGELGIAGDKEGIIEVAASHKELGKRFVDVAGLNDPVIDISVTPNRGDCLGVYGIARDLAAAGLGTLKPIQTPAVKAKGKSSIAVEIKNLQACPFFLGRYFTDVKNGPSPEWLAQRLRSIGVNPISALVDITNYITFTFSRPLHVYDADKIQGPLVVRDAAADETMTALDNKTYRLNPTIPVIADKTGAQAIAGIIGGAASGCSPETTNVFLEVAWFDPVVVAKAGRALDINTDSRYRFERKIDPGFMKEAVEIASQLIIELCGGQASEVISAGNYTANNREVAFQTGAVKKLTGIDADASSIKKILESLGCTVHKDNVTVPSWRPDIEGEADVVEEVARIVGYDKIPAVALPYIAPRATLPEKENRHEMARLALVANGLVECITWSFMAKKEAEKFANTTDALTLLNPISADLDYMRPSIVPNLLASVVRNVSRGYPDLGLFEVGPVYKADGQELCVTTLRSGKAIGRNVHQPQRDVDLFDVKADSMTVLAACGISAEALRTERSAPSYYHPGRSGALLLGKTVLAYFGQVHPSISKRYDLTVPVMAAEIMLGRLPLSKHNSPVRKALALSEYQQSVRDFAFILDETVAAEDIIRLVQKADKEKIREVTLFDVYQGKHTEAGKKSVAFSIRIQASDHTLTEGELEETSRKVIDALSKLGGVLRN